MKKRVLFIICMYFFSTIKAQNNSNILEENLEHDIKIQMILVQGGSFQMGSNEHSDEKPTHQVTLSDFYIGKTEVTQKQWYAVMGSKPSNHYNCENCPVEKISWNDIVDFLEKINLKTRKKYRLLSEAEWEYAARGGNKSLGYTYSGSNNIEEVAWHVNNSQYETHPVGEKLPNEISVYDMTGNVSEWCQDTWHDNYQNAPINGSAWESADNYKVIRGGAWYVITKDNSYITYRHKLKPTNTSNCLGFRLCLDTK